MFQTVVILIPLLAAVDSVANVDISNESNPLSSLDNLDNFSPTADQYEAFLSTLHNAGISDQKMPSINARKFAKLFSANDKNKAKIRNHKDIERIDRADSAEAVDDIPYYARLRRSSPGLMKLLKMFFVTTTSTTSTTETPVEETEDTISTVFMPSPITRENINQQENNIEKVNEGEHINDIVCKLDETLQKLDEKITTDILKSKDDQGFLLVKIPFGLNNLVNRRSKREVKQDKAVNVTKLPELTENKGLNVTKLAVKMVKKSRRKLLDLTQKKNPSNATQLSEITENKSVNVSKLHNNTISAVNISDKANPTNLRKANLHYGNVVLEIDSVYNDIKSQIDPIKQIKSNLSSDKAFKVGYIIANLETLELTLKKLVLKIKSMNNWNDDLALKVLDKLELSKTVVSNLMEYIKIYTKSAKENKN